MPVPKARALIQGWIGDLQALMEPLVIAYYCTGHGLGHATRSVEICKHLVAAGHSGGCQGLSALLGQRHLARLQHLQTHAPRLQ